MKVDIIKGSFSELVLSGETQGAQSVVWLEGVGHVKTIKDSVTNLDLRKNASDTSDQSAVKDYLIERTKPCGFSGIFRSIKLRIDKLRLGADLLEMLKNKGDSLDDLKVLYDRAVLLESINGYPAGRLGNIIIDLRRRLDGPFEQEYKAVLDNQILVGI